MESKFDLTLSTRADGVRVWFAECRKCGDPLYGELKPQVVVIRVREGQPQLHQSEFDQLMHQAHRTWNQARKTGNPVIMGDDRFEVASTHDQNDMQRALEAHVAVCLVAPAEKPEPTSMPGPGEPRG